MARRFFLLLEIFRLFAAFWVMVDLELFSFLSDIPGHIYALAASISALFRRCEFLRLYEGVGVKLKILLSLHIMR